MQDALEIGKLLQKGGKGKDGACGEKLAEKVKEFAEVEATAAGTAGAILAGLIASLAALVLAVAIFKMISWLGEKLENGRNLKIRLRSML